MVEFANLSTVSSCRYLLANQDLAKCLHPQVRLGTTSPEAAICDCCSYYCEKPRHEIEEQTAAVRTWAVGMTTAPRSVSTLQSSLKSVQQAGWKEIRLFAEPNTDLSGIPEEVSICQRGVTLGAFPNWLSGLLELYLLYPQAEAYVMFQDDLQVASGTRSYLENQLPLFPSAGVISLYCPSHYGRGKPTGFVEENHGWDTWGALAYVFLPEALMMLLSDLRVLMHRKYGRASGLKNIDSVVGEWCRRLQRPYLVHVPSLVQHTGRTSTLYRFADARGRRRAAGAIRDLAQLSMVGEEE